MGKKKSGKYRKFYQTPTGKEEDYFLSFEISVVFCKNLTSSELLWSTTSSCSLRQAANLPIDLSTPTSLMLLCDLAVKWYNVLTWQNSTSVKGTEACELVRWSTLALNPRCIRTHPKGRVHRESNACGFEFGGARLSPFTLVSC